MCTRARLVAVAGLVLAISLVAEGGPVDRELLQQLRLSPAITTTAPPLALKRVHDGRTLSLSQLKGRVVLLYFWATW
jgi:hypothetical protein